MVSSVAKGKAHLRGGIYSRVFSHGENAWLRRVKGACQHSSNID
jgi:hypothetical protein